jgi:hypothetical protein
MVVMLGVMVISGPVGAQPHVLRLPPLVIYQMTIKNSDSHLVFDIRGEPTNQTISPLILTGRMRLSPKICNGTYQVAFIYTTNRGRSTRILYTARVSRGRLDGVAAKCPYAGLPRRGLKSMNVQMTIHNELLLRFKALGGKSGNPFARLGVPRLEVYRTDPAGRLRIRIRARYPDRKPHIIRFDAALSKIA